MTENEKILVDSARLDSGKVIKNPTDEFFINFLRDYYTQTQDGQYLFGSMQPGRRPDRAFYIVPECYKLGKGQKKFDGEIGKKIYEIAFDYLREARVILQEGVQGEASWKTDLQIVISVENPHSGYIAWMGKQMIFPPRTSGKAVCFNYIIPEPLPEFYTKRIKEIWPGYDPSQPLTLYDLTEMKRDKRRVLNLGVDYFGGAYKKPNLTMVWNRAEADGCVSYHAGSTPSRILKGLSGTGKTTLTVGHELEQDDANVGKVIWKDGKVEEVQLIGLEAASFAKSEGLTSQSPEWLGLMKSGEIDEKGNRPIVLAMNIDCDGVEYRIKKIGKHECRVPVAVAGKTGSLKCTRYEKSGTTNGRFIFLFSELNKDWGKKKRKILKTEGFSFKRFDVVEPMFRVIDPEQAVALDSACESIITSAVAGKKPGTRTRSYAATDFMAREQSQQALLKLKVYRDFGLELDGRLAFFIVNSGYVGEYDLDGNQRKKIDSNGKPVPKRVDGEIMRGLDGKTIYEGMGEKIKVKDSKKLLYLVESRKIKHWLEHPIYGYLIPDPKELEEDHGMKDFGKRFNPLRYYSSEEVLAFAKRDIRERTDFLRELFGGQSGAEKLKEVVEVWEKTKLPRAKDIEEFYGEYYN
ncbi:MAG TPA: phosphoenolpyruvate carboxykinase (ATP) [Thermoplasmata archaeon]|nr:phosphoenolpyruvate carboxykinase (ATP) [Thermoplasmata archaeon]